MARFTHRMREGELVLMSPAESSKSVGKNALDDVAARGSPRKLSSSRSAVQLEDVAVFSSVGSTLSV
jgi:hypothetical protein